MRLTRIAIIMAMSIGIAMAQPATGDATLGFEVASVKPATLNIGLPRFYGGPGTADPGRIAWESISLSHLLIRAYAVEADQISGPSWIESEKYAVVATFPPETTQEQFRIMLQNLLAERFKLVVHHEVRDLPVYELTVAKDGPKLVEPAVNTGDPGDAPKNTWDKDGCPVVRSASLAGFGRFQNGTLCSKFVHYSMPDLVSYLEGLVGMEEGFLGKAHIIDETGISGKFDVTLRFHMDLSFFRGTTPVAGQAEDPDGLNGPDLFVALEQQLGLRLHKAKASLDRIVVDHAEKVPTDN